MSLAEARFDAATAAVRRRLPGRLGARVPQTLIGFVAINGFTFAVDLTLLGLFDQLLEVPHPVAISVGYGVAFTLAFVLNRWLNFHAHGRVGSEVGRYAVVVTLNYAVLVLGMGGGLAALGVPVLLARVAAGLAEAAWMYAAMRWWVFGRPDRHGSRTGEPLAPRGA